jgi:ATP-binding cassette subfamily F protein 3
VANKIVEVRDGELVLYRGDYAYYLEKKREETEASNQDEARLEQERKREANRLKQQAKEEARKAQSRKTKAGKT